MESPRESTPDKAAFGWVHAALDKVSDTMLGDSHPPFNAAIDAAVFTPLQSRDVEIALIERTQASPEAFGRLFELNYAKVLNYIYRCTLNLTVAEELTSNTFFNAFRALGRYRHRGHFSAWLLGIATNEIRMHWRTESRKQKTAALQFEGAETGRLYFESPHGETEESIREKMTACALLHELLGKLPERQRSVIMLRYFENLPLDGIAQALALRIGTVKSLLHRAVKRLRIIIEQDATFRNLRHFNQ